MCAVPAAALVHRATALDVFLQQTSPLISYYQDQGKLKLIDGAQPPEVVEK